MLNICSNIINTVKQTTSIQKNRTTNAISFGLKKDVFERRTDELSKIKIGKRINGGREADVYEVKGHPDWVLRHERDYDFDLKGLKFVENPNNAFGVIAENENKSVQVLTRKEGKPLHGLNWDLFQVPSFNSYLKQLKEFEEIPDKAFVDYFKQVLELRSNGYNIDTMNPNNILYDAPKEKFNIVDISENRHIKPNLEYRDIFTFLDANRTSRMYKKLSEEERMIFAEHTHNFIDRIVGALNAEGINIKIPEINKNELQDFMIYVYHNDETMLKFYRK